MTDLEALFLAIYPLWPKAMLAKFASVMPFEIAKFNPVINQDIIKLYESLGGEKKIKISDSVENISYLLTPRNPSKLSKVYYGREIIRQLWAKPYNAELIIMGPDLSEYRSYAGQIIYDNRIYASVSGGIAIEYTRIGTPYSYSYLSIMSYSSEFIQNVIANSYFVANTVLNPYRGAESVLAMIENGVQVNADEKLMQEFVRCINAYKKYGEQLAAANSLQTEKNRQALAEYKAELDTRLLQRKNELADMKTQIAFAAKNETNSAKRDMQNLALSAHSLILQLQDRLK